MKPMNANEADYEEFEILGREALFTNMRIDRNTLPDGLYAYDLRYECNGEPNELKSFVLVNHWGTVVVKEPIESADSGVELMLFRDLNVYKKFKQKFAYMIFAQNFLLTHWERNCITPDDCNFLGGDMSLEDFLNGSPQMEQRM